MTTKALVSKSEYRYGTDDDNHEVDPADLRIKGLEALTDSLSTYRHMVVVGVVGGTTLDESGFNTITKIIVKNRSDGYVTLVIYDGTNWAELRVPVGDKLEICSHEVGAGPYFRLEAQASTTGLAEIWIFGT